MNSLRLLDEFYEKADIEGKRSLVGMLYPEKLTFDGVMYRTPSMNLAAELIYPKNKELSAAKKFRQKKKQSFQTAFKTGVEYGARTHDPRYHKPML